MGPKSVYKICPKADWAAAQHHGALSGSPDDLRDGYIHLSTRAQLAGTAARHFAGKVDLMLLTVETGTLSDKLRWEPSRGGALFPHLYADLPVSAVTAVHALDLGRDGIPLIPDDLE